MWLMIAALSVRLVSPVSPLATDLALDRRRCLCATSLDVIRKDKGLTSFHQMKPAKVSSLTVFLLSVKYSFYYSMALLSRLNTQKPKTYIQSTFVTYLLFCPVAIPCPLCPPCLCPSALPCPPLTRTPLLLILSPTWTSTVMQTKKQTES